MKFVLSENEIKKLNGWLLEHDKTCPNAGSKNQGAIGGRLTYSFTPTSLGTFSGVKCACGAQETLTNLSEV